MTGLAGLELTSESGAESWLILTARTSRAMIGAELVAARPFGPAELALAHASALTGAASATFVPPAPVNAKSPTRGRASLRIRVCTTSLPESLGRPVDREKSTQRRQYREATHQSWRCPSARRRN